MLALQLARSRAAAARAHVVSGLACMRLYALPPPSSRGAALASKPAPASSSQTAVPDAPSKPSSLAPVANTTHQTPSASSEPPSVSSEPTPAPSGSPSTLEQPLAHYRWRLAEYLKKSPRSRRAVLAFADLVGLVTPREVSRKRAAFLYYDMCASRAEQAADFWRDECHLPPTFQSWFTITNLHVWILTTRLRALPEPWGEYQVQFLLDSFFLDVEARIRDVCSIEKNPAARPTHPPHSLPTPPSPTSSLPDPGDEDFIEVVVYADANKTVPMLPVVAARKQLPSYYPLRTFAERKNAPEALISRQMKAFRDQFNGLTLALDLALAHNSDAELAAAVWRNLLGARGRDGIPYAHSAAEERVRGAKDDGSGVGEFVDKEVDKYVGYPQTMLRAVTYIRMEIARLAAIPDEVIVPPAIRRRTKDLEEMRAGTTELMFRDIPS